MRRALVGLWVVSVWAAGASVLYGPWTSGPSRDGVTISWAWGEASWAAVQFGKLPDYSLTGRFEGMVVCQRSSSQEKLAHVRLADLVSDTWYVYRLCFEDGECTPIGAFRTLSGPGQAVRFGVVGDTQWQWQGVNRVELVAWSMVCDPWPFHFVVHLGDLVESPIPLHWQFFFRSMGPMLRWAPLVPVLGNHERDDLSYYEHFTLPPGGGRMGERWWVLRAGDLVLVGLDSNIRKLRDYDDQTTWLRENLSGPEKHKIVVFHHPVFSSDASYGPGTEGFQKVWHPLFVELGVDLVLNGHAHNYERIERDGVTYLVVGVGGANLYRLADLRVEGSLVGLEGWYGYAAVQADAEAIYVRVVGVAQLSDGRLLPHVLMLDEFWLCGD